jgi:citrate lyase subunit beta / citryl-CoA lyase
MQPDGRAADRIAAARTFLFVPGDRPDRFDKAAASGADIVILDLEDAVAPAAKPAARQAVIDWLAADRPVLVRINAAGTAWFETDLALWKRPGMLGFMLPKAEPGATLERVARLKPTVALIETAAGVVGVDAVAAVPGVQRLAFGTIDLALDLDTTAPEVMTAIGTRLVVASRACGIAAPIDGVTTGFKEPSLVEETMRLARARGFGAKMCIHPAQIAPIRDALRPTPDALDRARRIVAADKASGGAAVALDGQMVDKPVVAKAYRILADAALPEEKDALAD